jgi:hypothetical protein
VRLFGQHALEIRPSPFGASGLSPHRRILTSSKNADSFPAIECEMRIFMTGLIILGLLMILVGAVGHMGPYEDHSFKSSIQLVAYDLSPWQRVTFLLMGGALITYAGKELRR